MLPLRYRRLLSAVALTAPLGCLMDRDEAERKVAFKGPNLTAAAAEALVLQTCLIEQSVGDAFLDAELWPTCPSAVSGEARALQRENGLRTGVIRGHAPTRFLDLLTSEQSTVNPQFLTFSVRKQEVIPTNGPIETSTVQVLKSIGGKPMTFNLNKAGYGWQVRPEELGDGQIRVQCEPIIQHGDRHDWLRPSSDGTQFTMQGELSVLRFPDLAFSTTLGPSDYLLIGGIAEAKESLGCAAFLVGANGLSRQRLLVIRAKKNGGDGAQATGRSLVSAASRGRGEETGKE